MSRRKKLIMLIVMIMSTVVLSSCWERPSTGDPNIPGEQKTGNGSKHQQEHSEKKSISLLSVSEGEFNKIHGWLNDDSIVYSTSSGQNTMLHTYNIFNGKSKTLYESDSPIVSVTISPSMDKLLIHSSPTTNKADITIINKEGKELVSQSIPSLDVFYVWNAFNENHILLSKFNLQWEYQSYILNIEQNVLEEISLEEPFAYWLSRDEFIYLDWDELDMPIFAPLAKQGVGSRSGVQLELGLENVFQMFAFHDVLLTVSVPEDDYDHAVYSFFTNQLKPIESFTVPQLTRFTDWLIPYHDYHQDNNQFLTFQPVRSGEADGYNDDFHLIEYDLKGGKKKVLLEGLDNLPIEISPNGEYCLYGYQLEKIIDLDLKKVSNLLVTE